MTNLQRVVVLVVDRLQILPGQRLSQHALVKGQREAIVDKLAVIDGLQTEDGGGG